LAGKATQTIVTHSARKSQVRDDLATILKTPAGVVWFGLDDIGFITFEKPQ
jgi:hypothetical protein